MAGLACLRFVGLKTRGRCSIPLGRQQARGFDSRCSDPPLWYPPFVFFVTANVLVDDVPCHCRRSPPCKCHSNIEKLCEPRPWRTGLPTPKASFANAQKRPPSIHVNIEPCRMQQPLASSPRLKNCRPRLWGRALGPHLIGLGCSGGVSEQLPTGRRSQSPVLTSLNHR